MPRTSARKLLGLLRVDPLRAAGLLGELLRAKRLFRGRTVGHGVTAQGPVRVEGSGVIELERDVVFAGGMVPTELISHEGALLRIGASSVINYGVSIESHSSVSIGRHCLLAAFVRVADSARRPPAPVVIGDDVWLAHGVIVEPGVTIGVGSVVTAGSVVTQDVPAGSLASGNPAQCVRLTTGGNNHRVEGRPWAYNSAS